MTNNCLLRAGNKLFLSYSYLKDEGIKEKAIEKWPSRNIPIYKESGRAYVDYDLIPKPTQEKLKPKQDIIASLKISEIDIQIETIVNQLKNAQITKCQTYRKHYKDEFGMSSDSALTTAMKRAVWEKVKELHKANCIGEKGTLKKGFLILLHKAFSSIYNSDYNTFCNQINKIKTKGIDSVVVDNRKLGYSCNNQIISVTHERIIKELASSPKAYTGSDIHRKLQPICKELNIAYPSERTVRNKVKEYRKNFEIHYNAYGKDVTSKITPYIGVISAKNASSQWQVDGWDLPLYFISENSKGSRSLKKLALIVVLDAYSRKVLSYSISESENRISLLEALQSAVVQTNHFPFEIVSDAHSYNLTQEVTNFKEDFERLGATWTVTSNPQQKPHIERFFKHLGERYFKNHYGYVGQGIKTRDKNGRSSQEYIDECLKAGKILSENEIKAIAVHAIVNYNRTPLKSKGKSPNQLFEESEKPYAIELDFFENLRLFTKKTSYKVIRGQITIIQSGIKYEYQLPAKLFKLNGEMVTVRYEDFDIIYLFDTKNDKPICSLKQKEYAHGALADQTPADIEIFNRNKGRLSGIKSQARKENEDLSIRVADSYPQIYEIMNHHTTPKDVLKEAEWDMEYNEALIRQGIDKNRIATVPKFSETKIESFKSLSKSKKELSPFEDPNHQISIVEIEE